jgi:hypothetical protein
MLQVEETFVGFVRFILNLEALLLSINAELYVGVFVCVYVCMYVRTYVCICMYIHISGLSKEHTFSDYSILCVYSHSTCHRFLFHYFHATVIGAGTI